VTPLLQQMKQFLLLKRARMDILRWQSSLIISPVGVFLLPDYQKLTRGLG
jgi:hypothetical protein